MEYGIKGYVWGVLLVTMLLMLTACGSPLPRAEETTKSPWKTFEQAMDSYDKVILNQTTVSDLRQLGFDPYSTPNVRILSYLDVIKKFMPTNSVKLEHLPVSVRECLAKQETCKAYEANPGIIKRKRIGSAFKDLLGFKRRTIESGWRFNALIVLDDGVAVYKVWSGVPFIDSEKSRRNPLGPLQGSGGDLAKDALGL